MESDLLGIIAVVMSVIIAFYGKDVIVGCGFVLGCFFVIIL